MENRQPSQPLSTKQVAQILRVEVRTVHRMATDGRLTPLMKLPGETGAYLFDPAEVDRLAAERTAA